MRGINKIMYKFPLGIFSFVIIIFLFSACASGSNQVSPVEDENTIEPVVNLAEVNKYSKYLVDINSYSTNGAFYQKKYEKEIISIIASLTENYEMEISKNSAGFYFDKKSNIKNRLYLGFDFKVVKDNNLDYGRYSTSLIKENVAVVMNEVFRFSRILNEKEVAGLVIGFKWQDGRSNSLVNIWIKKEDMILARESKITINEMYQRSTITNSEGKIILLPI